MGEGELAAEISSIIDSHAEYMNATERGQVHFGRASVERMIRDALSRATPSAGDVEPDHISDARQMVPAAMPDVAEAAKAMSSYAAHEIVCGLPVEQFTNADWESLARAALSPTDAQGDRT